MEVYFLADGKREDGEGVLVADGIGVPKKRVNVLKLPRGRLYPLFSGNNDISLCKGSKCRDDC